MEIRELRYFLAVAREGNITRAAESLHITQPSLSKALMQLERECGTQLLIRGKREVSLTEDGELLRDRAERLVQMSDQLESDIRASSGAISGEIRIGAGETDRMVYVARAIEAVSIASPSVRFNVFSANKVDILPRLDSGLIDFAVVPGSVDAARYEYLRIPGEETCGFVMRSDDNLANRKSLTVDDLAGRRVMLPERPMLGSGQTGWMSIDAGNYEVVATYNLFYNASVMVREGVGIMFCYRSLAEPYLGRGLTFVPLDPVMEDVYHCVWRRFEPLSKAARAFLDELRLQVASV